MSQYNHTNHTLKTHCGANNRPTALNNQPASVCPHVEGEPSARHWWINHNPKLDNEFMEQYARVGEFSDILGGVFLHYKKGQENLTKPYIQVILQVHKKGFANSTRTREAMPANRSFSSVNVRKSSVIVHKRFASTANNGYDKDLSKNHVSGQPIRYLSAFFVPDICLASQAKQFISTVNNLLQVRTVISKMIYSSNSYDGVTLQNTKALGQICRAVADVTESEPHHPMIFHSVVSTQKTTSGGSYHG